MKSELFPSLSDLTFAEKDPDTITQEIVSLYEQSSGRSLARADPVRLFIDAIILAVVQQRNIIDHAAKMNLLAYATGEYLDHLGALLGVSRLSAAHSTCTLQFTLGDTSTSDITISSGTRVSSAGYTFATTSDLTITAGTLSGNVDAQCLTAGSSANGLLPGQVHGTIISGTQLISFDNITETKGGTDTESDEAFRERIQIAPESFSVAGPVKAYEYFARSADADIIAVSVVGPPTTQPGHVEIYPLMTGGTLPSDETIAKVYEACNASNVRPDTDYVHVLRPQTVSYNLDMTFWVDEANSSSSELVKADCLAAVDEWILWQKSALGRDINPSELTRRLLNAGAKRCVISSPSFTVLSDSQTAVCSSKTVNYGGLERG